MKESKFIGFALSTLSFLYAFRVYEHYYKIKFDYMISNDIMFIAMCITGVGYSIIKTIEDK